MKSYRIKNRPITEPLHLCNDRDHWSNVLIDGNCWKCDKMLRVKFPELRELDAVSEVEGSTPF